MKGTRAVPTLVLCMFAVACSEPRESEAPATPASPPSSEAEALLERAIAYHDPGDEWSTFAGMLDFQELRPDGTARDVEVQLDVPTGGFTHRAAVDGVEVVKQIDGDGCSATVEGQPPEESAIEAYRLACEQIERNRNYYLYLWGLPMKLRDPGTLIDPLVEPDQFLGEAVRRIRVTYDADVGSDIWYFYFQPDTAKLVGYRFYHDETVGDGEYISLEDEVTIGEMRVPARRRWYINADDRFLGEDVLVGGRPVP